MVYRARSVVDGRTVEGDDIEFDGLRCFIIKHSVSGTQKTAVQADTLEEFEDEGCED